MTGYPSGDSWVWHLRTKHLTTRRSADSVLRWPIRGWLRPYFEELEVQLDEQELVLKEGTLMVATLVEAHGVQPQGGLGTVALTGLSPQQVG